MNTLLVVYIVYAIVIIVWSRKAQMEWKYIIGILLPVLVMFGLLVKELP